METLAFRKDEVTTRQSVQMATLSRERVSVGLEALANPSIAGTAAFPVTRTSGDRADIQPIGNEAQAHPSLVAAASGNDAGPPATRRST